MRKLNKYVLFSIIVVLGTALDQITKVVAEAKLPYQQKIPVLGDFFQWCLVHNDGAFLSLGSALPPTLKTLLLTVIPGLVLVALMVYLLRGNTLTVLENVAFALITAGGVGNIIDRILEGEVVDFMIMEVLGWHTGIFNVADLYIVIGILLFLLSYLIKYFRERKKVNETPNIVPKGGPLK